MFEVLTGMPVVDLLAAAERAHKVMNPGAEPLRTSSDPHMMRALALSGNPPATVVELCERHAKSIGIPLLTDPVPHPFPAPAVPGAGAVTNVQGWCLVFVVCGFLFCF